jgi:hypothetical protein
VPDKEPLEPQSTTEPAGPGHAVPAEGGPGHQVPDKEPLEPQSTTEPAGPGHAVPAEGGAGHQVPAEATGASGPGHVVPAEDPLAPGGEEEAGPAIPPDMGAESVIPPEASPRDRMLTGQYLEDARSRTGPAELLADGVTSFVAGAVLAIRTVADRELGRLEAVVGPRVAAVVAMARRVVGRARERIAWVRQHALRAAARIQGRIRDASTFVRQTLAEARRLIGLARSGVASAISRLRSLGSGIVRAIATVLAGALSWARDRVGNLLAWAARAGSAWLTNIRTRIEGARAFIATVVTGIVGPVMAAVVALIERLVGMARSAAMRAAAFIRDKVGQAIAVVARQIARFEERLARRAAKALARLVAVQARLATRGARLVRRVGRASRAAVAQLVASVLAALGRRIARLQELVESTRTGLAEVGQSAVERGTEVVGRGEALLAATEGALAARLTDGTSAAVEIGEQVASTATLAADAATGTLNGAIDVLADLSGDASHEAATAQAVVHRAGG